MKNYTDISTVLKRKLHRRFKKFRIPISKVIREVLEIEARRREEMIEEALLDAQKILRRIHRR